MPMDLETQLYQSAGANFPDSHIDLALLKQASPEWKATWVNKNFTRYMCQNRYAVVTGE